TQVEQISLPLAFQIDNLSLQLFGAILNEVVDQFGSRIVHLDHEPINFSSEIVEQPNRRHRHQQTERGSKQRFRDTDCKRRDTACTVRDTVLLSVLHTAERVDDSEHGSEQTHEWSSRTDSGQARKAALKFSGLDGNCALQSTFGCFD